jgi:CRP-like cAMP-binding protein
MAAGGEFELLRDAAPAELDELLARARRRRFSSGEVVFHAGDPADTLHLIRRGRFSVRIMTEFGDAATLNVIGPGDAFGELALLTPGAPRSATIVSLEDGETLSIHQIEFNALRERVPTIDRFLIGLLAVQGRRLSGQLVEALYLPADTRVRRRLLDVCTAFGPVSPGTVVPLTQEELATLAGTSRATVNKVLREEQAAGTIELARGRTTLLDPDALERRARPFAS